MSGIILIVIVCKVDCLAQNIATNPVRVYEMDDWITYKNCNYPTSVTEGYEYVYFGTSGGIIPYHKFRESRESPYTVSDGMSGDFVTAVLYDYVTNYLWAAHENGISFLSPTAYRWENISETQLNILAGESIDRLGTDGNYIWLQTSSGRFIKISNMLGYYVSEGGELGEIIWSPTFLDPLPNLPHYNIGSDYQFLTGGYIMDDKFRRYSISVFMINKNLEVYGGVWGLGLLFGDENIRSLEVCPCGPLQNNITSLAKSGDVLWCGSSTADTNPIFNRTGILKYEIEKDYWEYFENTYIFELVTPYVNDIVCDDSLVWIGTNEGLTIYDDKNSIWKRLGILNGLSDEVITSIALDDTFAWVGTSRGLNTVSYRSFKTREINLFPGSFTTGVGRVEVGPKKVWVRTENGLYSVNKKRKTVEYHDLFGEQVVLDQPANLRYGGIAVSDSILIFARYKGLIKYDVETEKWSLLPDIDILNEAYLFDMEIDGDYLWVGTDAGAILIRLTDFYSEHYTTIDGLAGNLVYHVEIDGDWVWFGTNQGLTKYNWRRYAFSKKINK